MTYDLVALEGEVRETEDMLQDLEGWEGIWLTFWDLLQKIVNACKGEETIYDKAPRVDRWIAEADRCRLDLRARRSRALGSYMCPALGVFLDTSIRTDEHGRFFELISTSVHEETDDEEDDEVDDEEDDEEEDEVDDEEDVAYRVVSLEHLDVAIDECRSVIAERRLSLQTQLERQRRTLKLAKAEQAEARLQESVRRAADHQYELVKQEAEHEHALAMKPATGHPARVFFGWLGGVLWSIIKGPLKHWAWLMIVAVALTIGFLRRPIASAVEWLTSHSAVTPQDSSGHKPPTPR